MTSLRESFFQAISALRDNELRALLSILGITAGIAGVLVLATAGQAAHFLIFKELETFGLKTVWIFRDFEDKDPNRIVREGTGIDNHDFEAIRAGCCSAISRVSPVVYNSYIDRQIIRSGNRYSNARVSGVGTDYLSINNDVLIKGRSFQSEDEFYHRRVLIIGPTVVTDLFGDATDALGKNIYIDNVKFTIIGVLQPKSRSFLASIGSGGDQDENNRILMPYLVQQENKGSKQITMLQAETVGLNYTAAAVTQLRSTLEKRHKAHYAYKILMMAQYIETANRILSGVTLVGILGAAVSLFVGGLGIMNVMATSVLERTREIGIRKALGARRNDILFQFLMESGMISTVGGLLGLCIGELCSFGFSAWSGVSASPSLQTLLIAVGVSTVIGVLSGYLPARRAANLMPVEALRHE